MILTIAKRELAGLFFSPIAYVVLGAFAIGASTFFLQGFEPGQPASMRSTFDAVVWLLVFLAPAISMRLISEELRSGTFERLMTSPVSDAQVVLGKWLGALVFFCVMLLPLVVHAIALELVGSPELGPIVTGMLGLVLVGALYLAIGVFASAWSQNQIIAFLVTVSITLVERGEALSAKKLPGRSRIVCIDLDDKVSRLTHNIQFIGSS